MSYPQGEYPQGGYQQGGYPGYQPGPPAYSAAPYYGAAQQQSTATVVVCQPTASHTTTVYRSSGDHFLTLSIVMTFICIFCGGLLPAVLTVAAIFVALSVMVTRGRGGRNEHLPAVLTVAAISVALSAKGDDLRGDEECARRKGRIALVLNILSIVLTIVCYVVLISVVVTVITADSSFCRYYVETYPCFNYVYSSYYLCYQAACF
ncbi:hypothetical protein EMCRGX_G007694 [Ephydatia muelleri]